MTSRHTVDSITSDELDQLYDELDRLRAGEEPATDPAVQHTPGTWIWKWNRATPEKRHEAIAALLADAARGRTCFFLAHEKRAEEDRKAWLLLARVRDEIDRWKLNTLEPQTMRAVSDIGRALDGPVTPKPARSQREVDGKLAILNATDEEETGG